MDFVGVRVMVVWVVLMIGRLAASVFLLVGEAKRTEWIASVGLWFGTSIHDRIGIRFGVIDGRRTSILIGGIHRASVIIAVAPVSMTWLGLMVLPLVLEHV